MAQVKENSTPAGSPLPLVSVIIPFYNDWDRINDAIETCVGNTYPNLEIIVVDDCSSRPLEMEDFVVDLKERPIKILRTKQNGGPGHARNYGINYAEGELIAFLDSDDVWMNSIVEKQVDVFLKNKNAVWVYADGYYIKDGHTHHKPNSGYHGFKDNKFPEGKEVNAYHLKGYNYITFSSNMFKKSILKEVGMFDDMLEVSEDWDLFVRVAEKYPIHAINEPLMFYRINNSGRHFLNRKGYIDVNVKILKGLYERQGLLPEQQKDFDRAVAFIYQKAGIQAMNAGLNKEARSYLFHPKSKALGSQFRMIILRSLSILPIFIYNTCLWIFDHS